MLISTFGQFPSKSIVMAFEYWALVPRWPHWIWVRLPVQSISSRARFSFWLQPFLQSRHHPPLLCSVCFGSIIAPSVFIARALWSCLLLPFFISSTWLIYNTGPKYWMNYINIWNLWCSFFVILDFYHCEHFPLRTNSSGLLIYQLCNLHARLYP